MFGLLHSYTGVTRRVVFRPIQGLWMCSGGTPILPPWIAPHPVERDCWFSRSGLAGLVTKRGRSRKGTSQPGSEFFWFFVSGITRIDIEHVSSMILCTKSSPQNHRGTFVQVVQGIWTCSIDFCGVPKEPR